MMSIWKTWMLPRCAPGLHKPKGSNCTRSLEAGRRSPFSLTHDSWINRWKYARNQGTPWPLTAAIHADNKILTLFLHPFRFSGTGAAFATPVPLCFKSFR